MITIILLFLQPSGEQWTAAERTTAQVQVEQAAAWWGKGWQVEARGVVEYADPFNDWAGVQSEPSEDTVILYLVDNSASGRRFVYDGKTYGGLSGWHVSFALPGQPWLVAHELGHSALGLPDVASGIDIMNAFDAQRAYAQGFAGCETLERLGQPCERSYLPFVGMNMMAMASKSTTINTPN